MNKINKNCKLYYKYVFLLNVMNPITFNYYNKK